MPYDTERYFYRAAMNKGDHDVLIRFIVDTVASFHRLRIQEYYSKGWHLIQSNKKPNRKEIDWELDAKVKTFSAIGYTEHPKDTFYKRGKVSLTQVKSKRGLQI